MGLSAGFLNRHIAAWEEKLTGATYPHRSKWPSRLFHHAPIENAAQILLAEKLLSRVDSESLRPRDVAGQTIISARERAHPFSRFYFRPRTPTQYHIEGIRKIGECTFGDQAHAPVLVMFVFDARAVLSMDGVRFSDTNMQSPAAADDCTEEFFAAIPFDKVYHEGAHNDDSIKRHRCAEVLAPSPMPLVPALQWIYCRSNPERATLLNMLGKSAPKWSKRTIVSDDLRVFEKRFTYVESLSIANNGVIFRLAQRSDFKTISVRIDAWNEAGEGVVKFRNANLQARPEGADSWRVEADLQDGSYLVKVHLEDHLAFENRLVLGDIPF